MGLATAGVITRLKRGWSVEKALSNQKIDCAMHITVGGVTRTASEWSKLTGVPSRLIRRRLAYGWSAKKAIENADFRKKVSK